MEFSIFDGKEDAYWWILCVEEYFRTREIYEVTKVMVAAMTMK
jgi:hypothetical protein